MNKKISIGTALALMLIMISATFSITMVYSSREFNTKMQSITEREAMYSKLQEIDNLARVNYLGDIDEELLMDSISEGYAYGLGDLYSNYIPAEEYAKISAQRDGRTVMVGISTTMESSGYIYITDVYPDSPAQNAGIIKGDMIVKVDDLDVTSENYDQAVAMLEGEAGTKVKIIVRRQSQDIELDITRRAVEVPTVTYSMLGSNAYIKIHSFEPNTPEHFDTVLKDILSENVSGILFDVRDNPGGDLDSVGEILDTLLPEGPIVSATYKNGRTELLISSDADELALPMVVITNGATASAAELFTQSLIDYDKAVSVGSTTYGKGVMQSVTQLTDGSAFELTIATYNPPFSDNYNGVGIKPEYEVTLTPEQQQNLIYNDLASDPQVIKALEVLNSTIIAEGGTVNEPSTEAVLPEAQDPDAEDSSESSDENEDDSADNSTDEENTTEDDESSNSDQESSDNASSEDESESSDTALESDDESSSSSDTTDEESSSSSESSSGT